jgi:hypothetical protein
MEILKCLKCKRVYPITFSGLKCEEEGCGGELEVVEIETQINKGNGHGYHTEPIIAS